jgi:hypothetical protein
MRDVLKATDLVEQRYQDASPNHGGVSIRSNNDPKNSLTIGLTRERWAVIHTDAELWQRITRDDRYPERELRTVMLDDLLEIPAQCFIGKDIAVDIVRRWMEGADVVSANIFSDDLFGL